MSERPAINRFQQIDWNDSALFLSLDPTWVDTAENATLEFCPLEKHPSGPILLPTEDWEGGSGGQASSRHQDPFMTCMVRDLESGKYWMWYHTASRQMGWVTDPDMGKSPPVRAPGGGSRCCLAWSDDGIHWEKPDLGLVPHFANPANNMIELPGRPLLSDSLCAIFPTRHPGATTPLAGSVFSQFEDAVYTQGITAMSSADGMRWDIHYPPTMPLDGDAHCVMWDERSASYLLTSRSAQHSRIYQRLNKAGHPLPLKRHIALAQSRDLIHWTPLLDVLETDEKDGERAQIYTMYILPYGNLYIGFPQIFYMGKTMSDGPLETQVAISHDLVNWTRVGDRQPFISNDGPGTWDAAHTGLTTSPPFLDGGRLRFWYSGKNTEHWQSGKAGIGTGTIRRDGFACWRSEGEGVVTSVPLEMRWASWPELNIDATEGSVEMEILDEAGNPLPGLAQADGRVLTGDEIRAVCTFAKPRGDFLRHSGRIRLRFHLKNSRLYAFRAPNICRSSG